MEDFFKKLEQKLLDKIPAECYTIKAGEIPVFCVNIHYGDWKHEHARCDLLVEEEAAANGYEIVQKGQTITEETGTDCYSAIHNYIFEKI